MGKTVTSVFIVAFSLICCNLDQLFALEEYSWKMLEDEVIVEDRLTKPIFLKAVGTEGSCRNHESVELSRFEGHPEKILVGLFGDELKDMFHVELSAPVCSVVVFGRKGQKPENVQVMENPSTDELGDAIKSEVGYFNSHFNSVKIYWEPRHGGKPVMAMRTLKSKELNWISSFIGDVFHVIDEKTGQQIYRHVVVGDGVEEIPPYIETENQQCEFDWENHRFDCEQDPERDWDRIWRSQNMSDRQRVRDNQEHPSLVPHFTKVGYAKTRVPEDIWETIMEFYHANRETQTKEVWQDSNTYTNHFEAPSYMIHLPEAGDLKPSIFNGLMPILAEWSGVDELEATACYGIRVYTNNARLMGHCDRMSTHAISAIINVDQDVEEDWPLEIYNHDGIPTNITMKPGDLVLYESASCQHGRPYTMKGNQYTNMFVHYRPVDRELWVH